MEQSTVRLASPGSVLVDPRHCGCFPNERHVERHIVFGGLFDHHHHVREDGFCAHRGCRFSLHMNRLAVTQMRRYLNGWPLRLE